MAFLIMMISFTVLVNIGLLEGFPFEVPQDPLPSPFPIGSNQPNSNKNIETIVIDKFFSDYDTGMIEPDFINSEENSGKDVSQKSFKIKDKTKLDELFELKKIAKSKTYLKQKSMKNFPDTMYEMNQDSLSTYPEIEQPPFQAAPEKFIAVWPKYLDGTMQRVLPFPEMSQNKIAIVEDIIKPEQESLSKRNRKSRLIKDNPVLESEIKKGKLSLPRFESNVETSEDNAPKGDITKQKIQDIFLPTKSFSDHKKILKNKVFPPKNKVDDLSVLNKDNQNVITSIKPFPSTPNATKEVSKTERETNNDDGIELRPMHENNVRILPQEPVNMPWNLRKINGFLPIMPFPELHQSRPIHRHKVIPEAVEASYKRVLPMAPEQRTFDIGGPVLYPQSNFEKSFHVPFF